MVHRLPLSTVPRKISLRYIAARPDAEVSLPLLESRRTLAYLVHSITLRHLEDLTPSSVERAWTVSRQTGDPERLPGGSDYPLDRWSPAGATTVVQIREDGTGVAIAATVNGMISPSRW